jgi:excisionase family DNA binding protein
LSGSRYLTKQGVAAYLSISLSTVERRVKTGRLPAPLDLEGRVKRWDRDAIDSAMTRRPDTPRPADTVAAATQRIVDEILAKGRLRKTQGAGRRHR